jgi:hypothetical protein
VETNEELEVLTIGRYYSVRFEGKEPVSECNVSSITVFADTIRRPSSPPPILPAILFY